MVGGRLRHRHLIASSIASKVLRGEQGLHCGSGGRGIGLLAESVPPEVHPGSHPAPLRSLFRERYGVSRLDPCSASGAGVKGGYDRDVKSFSHPSPVGQGGERKNPAGTSDAIRREGKWR